MAYTDTEAHPDMSRTEDCVNCGRTIFGHFGWQCIANTKVKGTGTRLEYAITDRYLAQDMLVAPLPVPYDPDRETLPCIPIAAPVKAKQVQVKPDISDWRAWRDSGLQPGECVCRIQRSKCDFHKGT